MEQSVGSFLVDYKGLNVDQMTQLRKSLSEVKAELKVVRNTLAKRAIADSPQVSEAYEKDLLGTNAFVFAYEDMSASAKALTKAAKDFEFFNLKSGFMDGASLDKDKITYLATLPGKDELRAKLLGTFQAPASQFVRVLNAVPGGLVNVLSAYKDQKS